MQHFFRFLKIPKKNLVNSFPLRFFSNTYNFKDFSMRFKGKFPTGMCGA